jgi:uncharacterized protein (DUF1330 family)
MNKRFLSCFITFALPILAGRSLAAQPVNEIKVPPPVYIIAQITVTDAEEYKKYVAGFAKIFSKYKGELLVVDENPKVLEGEWPLPRTIVMRFPSEEEASKWSKSEEYQELAKIRHRSATTNAVLAKGLK